MNMDKPKILDLFCCGGGASMGYHLAGFEVVGVDINPQPRYPFEFVQSDAFEVLRKMHGDFDAIHASPPCQGYSNLTPASHKDNHERLIDRLRPTLEATGKPYIVENVGGAREELINPVMLCGSMFGLRTQRHRFFETNWPVLPPCECDHSEIPLLVTTASKASRELRFRLGMKPKTVENAPLAYGIDWMGFAELKEAIPPKYTQYLGLQLRSLLLLRRAA
jgi:DNA (cytosine-5)-methyltransferase 1